ncbi:MAG: leucine-rich repeat domain-containing protein [Kiritimatiellae bacterium]|nr:leucine-rich repeat domain-containing protein [Kiritimatiellia bacterium]
MKRSKIERAGLAGLLWIAGVAAAADFDYEVNDPETNTLTITGYTGAGLNMVIPDAIDGLTVTAIGDDAFARAGVTNVMIPGSVTEIGDGVFYRCEALAAITVEPTNPAYSSADGVLFDKLATTLLQCPGARAGDYTVPGGVTEIGDRAFDHCLQLSNVTIAASVTAIADGAFAACSSLLAIHVDEANAAYCSMDGVLFDEAKTVLLQCPGGKPGSYAISNGVVRIGDNAFDHCYAITNIELAGSVTQIGERAFQSCRFATIAIPAGVASIGAGAFAYCLNLTAFTVEDANPLFSSANGVLFDKGQGTLLQYPVGGPAAYAIPVGVTNIGAGAFLWCAHLAEVTIPGTVSWIGEEAFRGCTLLTDITIPDSVTWIGREAFGLCESLARVALGGGLTSIEPETFGGCESLVSVIIPGGVTNVGGQAFDSCVKLERVFFAGNAPADEDDVFSGADHVTVYYLPGAAGWEAMFADRLTALWNPEMTACFKGAGTNGFGFTVTGTTNIPVMIECRTNLLAGSWVSLQTNALVGGALVFYMADSTHHRTCVYRIAPP